MSVQFKKKLKPCTLTILENEIVMDTPRAGAKLMPVHDSYIYRSSACVCNGKVKEILLQA